MRQTQTQWQAVRATATSPRISRWVALIFATAALDLSGCAAPVPVFDNAKLTPPTQLTRDLLKLPAPKGKVTAAVYGLRDQTGQYKPSPDSSFSSEVTQGAASMLIEPKSLTRTPTRRP